MALRLLHPIIADDSEYLINKILKNDKVCKKSILRRKQSFSYHNLWSNTGVEFPCRLKISAFIKANGYQTGNPIKDQGNDRNQNNAEF